MLTHIIVLDKRLPRFSFRLGRNRHERPSEQYLGVQPALGSRPCGHDGRSYRTIAVVRVDCENRVVFPQLVEGVFLE